MDCTLQNAKRHTSVPCNSLCKSRVRFINTLLKVLNECGWNRAFHGPYCEHISSCTGIVEYNSRRVVPLNKQEFKQTFFNSAKQARVRVDTVHKPVRKSAITQVALKSQSHTAISSENVSVSVCDLTSEPVFVSVKEPRNRF